MIARPALFLALLLTQACRSSDRAGSDTGAIADDADGDGWASADDCNDGDAAIHPDADELPYDGIDNDCDASTADDDVDADGYAVDEDCNDADDHLNPDATEVCDGVDNDCDGTVDGGATDAATWFADADGDGYGDAAAGSESCSAPEGYVTDDNDCDDTDPGANPGEDEVCDEIDNDCNGDIDDDASDAETWYADHDGDGFGDADTSATSCDMPVDFVSDATDCDDTDDSVYPGAAETWYDGVDGDCAGGDDDDADGDGYAAESVGGTDCADDDPDLYPEASGLCAQGIDCLDILDSGRGTEDGTYVIDVDGVEGPFEAFEVECDMSTDGGGWTLIDHDHESAVTVTGYEPCYGSPGAYELELTYDAESILIDILLSEATETEQYLYKDCYHSGIWAGADSCTWWTTSSGLEVTDYWPDDTGACDTDDGAWRADGGYVTDRNDLPIGSVFVGDTGDYSTLGETAILTVGPLMLR